MAARAVLFVLLAAGLAAAGRPSALVMPLAACPLGYTGTACDVTICQSLQPCLNNGTCYFNADGSSPLYLCLCPPGYSGSNCEILTDNCALAPRACENGGSCVNQVNDYTCSCLPGFSGARCQTNVDDCASSPCGANGCCVDAVNDYTCTCDPGYSGRNCQIAPLPCTANPCLNGATCSNGANGTYTCACRAGFVGNQCQQVASAGNQRCFATTGSPGFKCYCLPGFSGPGCTQGTAAPTFKRGACTYTVAGSTAASRLSWADAAISCSLVGANLTSITSATEGPYLKSIVTAGRAYWLGLRLDVTPIRWTDGSALTLLEWAANEPATASCVAGTPGATTLQWSTVPCTALRSYICKRCNATTPTTTRTTRPTTTRTTRRTTTRATTTRTTRATTTTTRRAPTTTKRTTLKPTTKKPATTTRTSVRPTTKAPTRPTTRTTAKPKTTTRRGRRELSYRAVMLAARLCFPNPTPTSLDVVAVNAITGQVLTNFTVQLSTSTFTSPASAFPNCLATACTAPCALFFDPVAACRVCVCNPNALSQSQSRDPSTGFASFTLPSAGTLSLQAVVPGYISLSSSKLVLTRRMDAGYVIPLFPSPLTPSGTAALTVLVTLSWLDDGLASHRDFDSYLRTSYALPGSTVPAELCTVHPGGNCNQGFNSASFITNNARVGLFPSPYSGTETIRITATTGVYQHLVYGRASDSNFAGSNARVEVVVLSAAGAVIASRSVNADVDGATGLSCGRRRFWNTFLIDLRTSTPVLTTTNSIDCAPTIPPALSAYGTFSSFPNENGARVCC